MKKKGKFKKAKDIGSKIITYVVIALFWIGTIITFVAGCFGTFFESSDNPSEDYEEYINIP